METQRANCKSSLGSAECRFSGSRSCHGCFCAGVSSDRCIRRCSGLVIVAERIFSQLPVASDVPAGSRIVFAKLETESDAVAGGLPILARLIHEKDPGHLRREIPSEAMLAPENASSYDALRKDLQSGISGTRRMPFKDQDSFWAYAPVNKQIAAILIVPHAAALEPINPFRRGLFRD